MSSVLDFLAGAGLVVVSVAAVAFYRLLKENKALRDELTALKAPHTMAARVRADAAEATLFDLIHLRDEAQFLIERLEFCTRRAAHIRDGGSPDDMKRPRKKAER